MADSKVKVKPEIAASPNPAELKREALKQLMPEAFSEGKVDVAALKRALGEELTIEGGERYRLDWVGKSEAYKVLQAPTTATLRPRRDQSVNFDTASHVFIEGENLETLKVLQKAYFGKVKLIYIDPPYNTGNDHFVYPDRFQESKEDYLKRINDLDDDGSLMREGFFRKNSRESGHYHSNWLSMMLPRLYIARNLLHEQGVIFVSCDDNEVHNLRCLLDEVFGSEAFVACCVWQKRYSRENRGIIGDAHDYLLVYARNPGEFQAVRGLISATKEQLAVYKNPNDHPRGRWRGVPMTAQGFRKNQMYEITTPSGDKHRPPEGRCWGMTEPEYEKLRRKGRIWFGKNGNAQPSVIRFLDEVEGLVPWTWWPAKEVGHTDEARKEIRAAVGTQKAFDTPKPVRLLKRILEIASPNGHGDLVLDFFGGSGTTLEAVIRQNLEDGGTRQCILVQMPEPIEADDVEFESVSDVARTRIRAALEDIKQTEDLVSRLPEGEGFKAYTLAPSNFRQWRGDEIESGEALAEQIKLFMQSEKAGTEAEAILHEIMLKQGYELTAPIETMDIAGHPVQSIDHGKTLFVLEAYSEAMLDPLIECKPEQIVALDSVFKESDQLKTNLALQCRDAGIRIICL